MMKYKNTEFYKIIKDIYELDEVKRLDKCKHHGITRLDHCLRVSYYTYTITKALHLNYKDATRAALLHDFFIDEVSGLKMYGRFSKHLVKHMWPCTLTPPKYFESWIVDIIDDISAVFERGYVTRKELQFGASFLYLFILSRFR